MATEMDRIDVTLAAIAFGTLIQCLAACCPKKRLALAFDCPGAMTSSAVGVPRVLLLLAGSHILPSV